MKNTAALALASAAFLPGALADSSGNIQKIKLWSEDQCKGDLLFDGSTEISIDEEWPGCRQIDLSELTKKVPGNDEGGYQFYIGLDSDPNDGATVIVRSGTTIGGGGDQTCGVPLYQFNHAGCSKVNTNSRKISFQYCSKDECSEAISQKRSAKFRRDYAQTVYVGQELDARDDGRCNGDWKAYEGKEDYQRASQQSQIVGSATTAGTTQITQTRSSSYSKGNGMDAGLNIADIFSLGTSFSEEFTETVTDSTAYTFTVPKGQTGDIVFTPTLRCTSGEGTCNIDGNDETVKGELCTPQKKGDNILGEYRVVGRQ